MSKDNSNTPIKNSADSAQREARFKALIEGEFYKEYNESVQAAIKAQSKAREEKEKKLDELAPVIALLEARYGTAEGDTGALMLALKQDEPGARKEAGERARKEKASRLYRSWLRESADFRGSCPGFDLMQALQNAHFKELLRSGASIQAAYELANRDELMRKSAQEMEQRLIQRILSGAERARESGLTSQNGAVVKSDVANMSKSTRREIIQRVARGEKISF